MGPLGQAFEQNLFPDFTFKDDDAKKVWTAHLNDPDSWAVWMPALSFMAQFARTTEELLPKALDFKEAADSAFILTARKNFRYGTPSLSSITSFLGDVWVHGDKMKITFSSLEPEPARAPSRVTYTVAPNPSA